MKTILFGVAVILILSQGCLKSGECISVPCQGVKMGNIFQNLESIETETQIVFKDCENRSYTISTDLSISSTNNIRILGNHSTIQCTNDTVIRFTNVTNLYIENIHFVECGNKKQNGGLIISNCTNVTLTGITIENSLKTGLIISNVRGKILIETCTFQGNNGHWENEHTEEHNFLISSDDDFHKRGGGMQLIVGDEQINSSFMIRKCKFLENIGLHGGGLFLVVQERAYGNSVTITETTFEHNRCLHGGGALQIGYVHDENGDTIMDNNIYIDNSNFLHNEAKYGGGTAVFATLGSLVFSQNALTFDTCKWINNSATLGLAMDISISPRETTSSQQHLPSPVFINCNFIKNKDTSVTASPFIINKRRGALIVTKFKLKFENRTVFENNLGSAIEATAATLSFQQHSCVHFIGNIGEEGAAMNLKASTVVHIRDNSHFLFENNVAAFSGGAIYSEFSDKHSLFNIRSCFIRYVDGQEPVNVTLIFRNNTAAVDNSASQFIRENTRYRGDSIYATSLLSCFENCIQNLNTSTVPESLSFSDALKCIGEITFDYQKQNSTSTVRRQMSTAPHHFARIETDSKDDDMCLVFVNISNSTVQRNSNYNLRYNPFQEQLHLIPGKPTKIPLRLVDDFCTETFFFVQVRVVSSIMDSIYIHPAHSVITDNFLTLYGRENDHGKIQLTTPGIRTITVTLNVIIDQCPPGYVHKSNKDNVTTCQCSGNEENKYPGIERCNESEFRAYSQNGYWVGYIKEPRDESSLATALCPIGFCSNLTTKEREREHALPPSIYENVSLYICNANRTDVMCGLCRENHSAYYHSMSFDCRKNDHCFLGPLFYILSEIVPITLLFLIVIIFNISFTSGPLNGVIFFIQIIDSLKIRAGSFIWFDSPLYTIHLIRELVFRMFSLNFFSHQKLSFCLKENASALDMLVFKYITISYSLVLVVGTILLLKVCNFKLCRRLLPNLKGSIIHGLSAFLVMSYSECTRVSLMIVTVGRVCAGPGASQNISKVAFYNGNYSYMGPEHLKYALPAIFFIITIVSIPPLLLLSYPLCYKLFALFRIEESKFVQIACKILPLEKMKPLFDSIQGAFKDRYRFFAGLYFLYRLCALLSFSTTRTFTDHYTLTSTMLVFMLTLHATFRPYKKMWHNIVDACLFCNLFVINTITHYNYNLSFDKSQADRMKIMVSIQFVLIVLPLIYLIIYTVYSIVVRIKSMCSVMCLSSSVHTQENSSNIMLQLLDERESENSSKNNKHNFDSFLVKGTDYKLLRDSRKSTSNNIV